jgi:hypothetical protein
LLFKKVYKKYKIEPKNIIKYMDSSFVKLFFSFEELEVGEESEVKPGQELGSIITSTVDIIKNI